MWRVAFTPDGHGLVSGSLDKTLKYWDVSRWKAQEEASESEDTSVLDNLLEKLRSGENVGCRARRTRPSAASSSFTVDTTSSVDKEDIAGQARDMLARLQSDGFVNGWTNGPSTGRPNWPRESKRYTWDEWKDVGTREGTGLCTTNLTDHKDWLIEDVSNRRAQDNVCFAAISHDGQWVAGGSYDCGVQLWDAKSGIVQLVLEGHTKAGPLSPRSIRAPQTDSFSVLVRSVDFSPAGNLLATGSDDSQARICESCHSPESLLALICRFREIHHPSVILGVVMSAVEGYH